MWYNQIFTNLIHFNLVLMNKYLLAGQGMILEERLFPGEEITQAKYQVMDVVNWNEDSWKSWKAHAMVLVKDDL